MHFTNSSLRNIVKRSVTYQLSYERISQTQTELRKRTLKSRGRSACLPASLLPFYDTWSFKGSIVRQVRGRGGDRTISPSDFGKRTNGTGEHESRWASPQPRKKNWGRATSGALFLHSSFCIGINRILLTPKISKALFIIFQCQIKVHLLHTRLEKRRICSQPPITRSLEDMWSSHSVEMRTD